MFTSLDRILHSVARLIGYFPKYATVSAYMYMRDTLRGFPVSQRVNRIAALVWRCLIVIAPT